MFSTIFGIGGGLVSAGMAILGRHYLDPTGQHAVSWLILGWLAWPLLAWGTVALAVYRGHSSALGVALFIVGLGIYGLLVFHAHRWYVNGVSTLFVAIMPVVVLLSFPRRPGNLHDMKPRRRRP